MLPFEQQVREKFAAAVHEDDAADFLNDRRVPKYIERCETLGLSIDETSSRLKTCLLLWRNDSDRIFSRIDVKKILAEHKRKKTDGVRKTQEQHFLEWRQASEKRDAERRERQARETRDNLTYDAYWKLVLNYYYGCLMIEEQDELEWEFLTSDIANRAIRTSYDSGLKAVDTEEVLEKRRYSDWVKSIK